MFKLNPFQKWLTSSALYKALTAVCCLIFPLFSALPADAAIQVGSARVWPAQDYTRVTLESSAPITHNLFTIKNPERVVLDLEDVELNSVLDNLSEKISAGDPYIKQVR